MNEMTLVGNLVNDPELRYTANGVPVASFRMASTPRYMDQQTQEWKDGDTLFMSVSVWRQQAENVAESLVRGSRVVVVGKLSQRSYETREGEKRTVYEIKADDVGASLKNASAKINKSQRSNGGGGGQSRPAQHDDPFANTPGASSGGDSDPWADDPPPF